MTNMLVYYIIFQKRVVVENEEWLVVVPYWYVLNYFSMCWSQRNIRHNNK